MCQKTITASLFFLLLTEFAASQLLRRPAAAGYTSTGVYSLNQADVFSFTTNQAALAQLKNSSAGVYAERKFLLRELAYYHAVAGFITPSGNVGVKAGYFGFTEYNEAQLGLAYARKLGTKVDIGVQFNYNSIRIPSYGNASAISVELGTIWHLSEKLHTGIQVNNPVGGKFGKEDPDSYREEKLPSVYTIGFGYEASEKFFVSAELVKEEDQPVNINAGLQYKFIPRVFARAGVSTATSTIWAGAGLFFPSFRIDVTSAWHPQLGVTPGLSLLFNFRKKES